MNNSNLPIALTEEAKALTKDEIIDLVTRYLEPHQPLNYRLNVTNRVRHDDDFWYVVVQPTRDDIRSYDYYARLSEAARDIEEQENVNVLLVPTLPG